MPSYAGMPEDTRNLRTDECGCKFVLVAAAGRQPQGWVRVRECEQHKEDQ